MQRFCKPKVGSSILSTGTSQKALQHRNFSEFLMLLFFSLRIAGNSIWVHFWVHLRNMGAAKGLGALIPLRPSQRPCLLQRLFACEDLRPQMRFGMITFGEMRSSGVRDVLIYCRDHRC